LRSHDALVAALRESLTDEDDLLRRARESSHDFTNIYFWGSPIFTG
jgi:hypothetical protein